MVTSLVRSDLDFCVHLARVYIFGTFPGAIFVISKAIHGNAAFAFALNRPKASSHLRCHSVLELILPHRLLVTKCKGKC